MRDSRNLGERGARVAEETEGGARAEGRCARPCLGPCTRQRSAHLMRDGRHARAGSLPLVHLERVRPRAQAGQHDAAMPPLAALVHSHRRVEPIPLLGSKLATRQHTLASHPPAEVSAAPRHLEGDSRLQRLLRSGIQAEEGEPFAIAHSARYRARSPDRSHGNLHTKVLWAKTSVPRCDKSARCVRKTNQILHAAV